MRKLALLSIAACAAFFAGCATPVNYYMSPGPVLPALAESQRGALLRALGERLSDSKIARIELRDGDRVRRVSLVEPISDSYEDFPLDALSAALWAADPDLRGAEFDLVVRSKQAQPGETQSARIVTARHDIDGVLLLLMGGPPQSLRMDATESDELTQRFGIGPLLDGDAAWSPSERAALAQALELLTADELSYLRYLPFRRDRLQSNSQHAGYYTSLEAGFSAGLVVLLDSAFSGDTDVFVGTPDRAYPQSIAVILHELGHALAKLDRERLLTAFERDRTKYNELVGIFNEYVEALNVRYAAGGRQLRISDRRRIEREVRELEENHRKLRSILRGASDRLDEMAELASGPSPIEAAYAELPKASLGPTPYGRRSPAEGFAEAFALFHLDPDSLARFSPEIHDWFARGGHISAALFPPLEDVASPGALAGSSGPEGASKAPSDAPR